MFVIAKKGSFLEKKKETGRIPTVLLGIKPRTRFMIYIV